MLLRHLLHLGRGSVAESGEGSVEVGRALIRLLGRVHRLVDAVGIVLGSLFLLVLALASSAFLSFSALDRAQMSLLSEAYHLAGREAAAEIEEGLRFGRPLGQFLGLDEILAELQDMPEVATVGVTDADGTPLDDSIDALAPPARVELQQILSMFAQQEAETAATRSPPDPAIAGEQRHFLTPLRDRDDALAGLLVISVPLDALAAARSRAVADAVTAMLTISFVAGGMLAVAAGRMRGAMARRRGARWRWMVVPLAVLLSAQAAYAAFILQSMRVDLAAATEKAAERVVQRAGGDLEQLLSLGLGFDRMPGLETRLSDLLARNDAVKRLVLEDGIGTVHVDLDRPVQETPGWLTRNMPVPRTGVVMHDLADRDGDPAGRLVAEVEPAAIASGLAEQTVKVLTVAATSAFVMIELFILLQIVLSRAPPRQGSAALSHGLSCSTPRESSQPDHGPLHLVARPVMFAFVLSWALPLSFLPLKMQAFGGQLWGLPEDLVLALPISVEMAGALVMAMFAGRLADRVGWLKPVLIGLLLSFMGGVGAALAPDSASFVLARGVTGLGYGLAWMGLQAFVIQACGPQQRGKALANLMAGILAGFITGTALGGILAEQIGQDLVLLATGLMVIAPLLIALVTLRPFMDAKAVSTSASGDVTGSSAPGGWATLLRSPEYMGVLLLSVVPFSIAQVGLLYFAVPLHLDRIGAAPADAGRILMIYGVVVIFFGPVLSRWIDRSRFKTPTVVTGGLVGGLGLTVLLGDLGLAGMFLAAVLLSLSSVLIEPARAAVVLRLPAVQSAGRASALGMQRAADKLGQMVGPVAIAMMMPAADMMERVAFLGLGFAAASVLLAGLIWQRHRETRDHG